MPANVINFLFFTLQISNLNIIPVTEIIQSIFDFPDEDPYNDSFYRMDIF